MNYDDIQEKLTEKWQEIYRASGNFRNRVQVKDLVQTIQDHAGIIIRSNELWDKLEKWGYRNRYNLVHKEISHKTYIVQSTTATKSQPSTSSSSKITPPVLPKKDAGSSSSNSNSNSQCPSGIIAHNVWKSVFETRVMHAPGKKMERKEFFKILREEYTRITKNSIPYAPPSYDTLLAKYFNEFVGWPEDFQIFLSQTHILDVQVRGRMDNLNKEQQQEEECIFTIDDSDEERKKEQCAPVDLPVESKEKKRNPFKDSFPIDCEPEEIKEETAEIPDEWDNVFHKLWK